LEVVGLGKRNNRLGSGVDLELAMGKSLN